MDKELRALLIEHAKFKNPIEYNVVMQQLGLKSDDIDHRNRLSYELGEIARFEHQNNRPLLSAMAMYQGKKKFGFGFYEISEELGYGDAKVLEKQKFAYAEQQKCIAFWRSGLTKDIVKAENKNEPEFFTEHEMTFLNQWADKVYDPKNKVHVDAKNFIKDSIGTKVVYWSNQLVKRLDGYETFNWRMWNKKGWEETEEGKKRVARFKPYSWARVYKIGQFDQAIFFTILADGKSKMLVYKLDYFFEKNSPLSKEQKRLCEELIPDHLKWLVIPFEELKNYSWEKLLSETEQFIRNNDSTYQEVVDSVWSGTIKVASLTNKLIPRETPSTGITELPTRTYTFNGFETDWEQQNKEFADIGKLGEELVIEYEKNLLINTNRSDLAELVKKAEDGKGYDIESRYPDDSIKYIEVKTTVGNESTLPILTHTEIAFSERNSKHYHLYRVFNLKRDSKVAEFHEYCGKVTDHFIMEGIAFNAHRKKKGN